MMRLISYKGREQMLKKPNYKIGLYVRVSTEEQALNPEGSIKSQEQRLRETVDWKNRYAPFGEIVGVYIDAGISAKDMNRPKLQEMLTAIKAKQINLVMVTELSRLSRDMHDFLSMWNLMRNEECNFTSLREDFDTSTAAGEMLMFSIANFAQFERRQISERVVANLTARAARGLYNGGPVPIGYKLIHERPGYLSIDEDYGATVKIAFDVFLREGCLSKAARWLNSNNYALKRHIEGGSGNRRVGYFTSDFLYRILKNKAYLGIKIYKERGEIKETKAVWEALIDEVTFKRAGELLAKNKNQLKPSKKGFAPYLLTGVSFCKTCGSRMPGRSATGKKAKVMYYEHSWQSKKDQFVAVKSEKCTPYRIQAKIIEKIVWDEVFKFLKDKEIAKAMLTNMHKLHYKKPDADDIPKLRRKLKIVEVQLEALSERLSSLPKKLSPAPIYKLMEKMQEEKIHLEDLVEEKNQAIPFGLALVRTEEFTKISEHYLRLLENCTDEVKKKIIQKVIHRIEIGDGSLKIFWNLSGEYYKKEIDLIDLKAQNSTPAITAGVLTKNNFVIRGSSSLTNGVDDGALARFLRIRLRKLTPAFDVFRPPHADSAGLGLPASSVLAQTAPGLN